MIAVYALFGSVFTILVLLIASVLYALKNYDKNQLRKFKNSK
jgi:hypothetical protein